MTGDEDEPADFGAPPTIDPLAHEVRRSRVANQLFDTNEHVRIGRYQLLERVGAGGIGVVWGAWDPELERRVAIKVLKTTAVPRERIVAEGQALAKLSHPNVVPIYDVGVHDDQVYLVMEWIRGETLREYVTPARSVKEIVALYREAAVGLAAAHDAGLIHRDFKPDNAVRGEDGRVRVLDFGLARGAPEPTAAGSEPVTRGAGTPRYMAPEQLAASELTPAADQYAYCVSLREALLRRSPSLPSWLAAIVDRGTSEAPRDRFASMRALLGALDRDPATLWRRRALAVGALACVGAAFGLGSLRSSSDEIVPCTGGEAEIAKTWNAHARERLTAHLRGLGAYGADEAGALADELAGYAKRWAGAQRDTCLARERRLMTEPAYALTLGCLARARVAYGTVVDVLSSTPASRLSNAIVAARGLPAIENCALESAASPIAPPPTAIAAQVAALAGEVERARVLAQTDDPDGVALTKAALPRADALGYAPLVGRAYLAHGLALLGQQQPAAAIPILDRASLAATDALDDPTFVEAYARASYARSTTGDTAPSPPPAREDFAERVALRSGTAGAFARALLFNNLGTAALAAGDRNRARTWFDRALAETAARDRDAELLFAFTNRALVTDDPAERDRWFEQGRTGMMRLLGAKHRKTLDVRFTATAFIADPRKLTAELVEVCALFERYHADVAPATLASCQYELGWLAVERGDVATARAALVRVDDTGPLRASAQAQLLWIDGKPAEAAAAARAVGERFATQSWARLFAADAYRFAATCEAQLGHRTAALADARAALALFDQLAYLSQMARYQRPLAHTRALLAQLVPADEAMPFAEQAAQWYRAAGGYDDRLRELATVGPR